MQLSALFRLAFASASDLQSLTLLHRRNSPVRSTKSTRSHLYRAPSACKHRVSGSFSLPSRGSFHLSLTVLCAIGHQVVFSLGGWSPLLPAGFLVSCGTLVPALCFRLSPTRLLLPLAGLSFPIRLDFRNEVCRPSTPESMLSGLGSSPFARRYLGNRFYFLFLRLLRCFSSPGPPHKTMDSSYADIPSVCRVSTFGHPRVEACLRLTVAFRSLPRPSSALGARASALCSSSLDFFLDPETIWQSLSALYETFVSYPRLPSGKRNWPSLPYFTFGFSLSSSLCSCQGAR